MAELAAFLRGINVGGHRVTGPELRAPFEELGLTGVATFRASGNVVFGGADAPPAELEPTLEAALEAALGYAVATFVRTADEVRAMAAHQPFRPAELEASKGKLQVMLLREELSARDRKAVLALATEQDRLAIEGRELYWLPSGGTLKSELDLAPVGELLGVGTTRTKGTVEQLAAKHFG